MRLFIIIASVFLMFTGCSPRQAELKTGTWRGALGIQGYTLPFLFDVEKKEGKYQVWLRNDTERLLLDEVSVTGDTVSMVLHIFDAELRARIDGNRLSGTFVKHYAPEANMPFSATFGDNYLFAKPSATPVASATNYAGKYQLEYKNEKETYASVGVFSQQGNHLTGTFLTPMGDYRYLEGDVVNDSLYLSTFDGNHAFLFRAYKSGDSLKGDYHTGKKGHETFKGIYNMNATMPDAESLTYLKPGYDRIEFSFPDVSGKKVSLSDEKFRNKVVILQLFGTWCPNCMDETKFLSAWYNQNHDRGVEILGLAYERKPDFTYASERVKKMIAKLKVPYDFVIAGVNDKEKAAETLPMLNKVVAFPTTIYIGKDGKVKHIRTGFEGPGTGIYHEQFRERFNQIISELLAEDLASSK